MKHLRVVIVLCVTFVAACAPGSREADEAAIRDAHKTWLAAIAIQDSPTIGALHAADAQFLPPNLPKLVGRDAVQRGWADVLGFPGLKVSFETEKLVIAESGDLAVDIGTYELSAGEGRLAFSDKGKIVVTWTKRDGKWLILTDMFSSDLPPPAALIAPATTP